MRSGVLACALLGACTVDGSIGRADDTAADSDALGSTMDDPSATGDGVGTHGGSSGDEAATGGGTGGGSLDETGQPGSSSGIHDPATCEPVVDDTACEACRKLSCCQPLDACLAHAPCVCLWQCVAEGNHTERECATGCEYDGTAWSELATCTEGHCPRCSPAHADPPP